MNNINHTEAGVPPMTRDEMRDAVVEVLWSVAHLNYRLFSRDEHPGGDPIGRQLADLLGGCDVAESVAEFLESSGREFGVTWERVMDTSFARTMEDLYDYAFLGLVGEYLDLGDESESRWATLALLDFEASHHLRELDAYSGRGENDIARRLLRICETAVARHILEGAGETFTGIDPDRLTIKQMALLSGMKEASLRVLANPKRPNPLPTRNDGVGTYVTPSDAKQWLKARDRYMPLRHRQAKHRLLDLAARPFRSRNEAVDSIERHLRALGSFPEQFARARVQLKSAAAGQYYEHETGELAVPGMELEPSALDDLDFVRRIGAAMNLDADLLALRIEEVLANERLARVDAAIQAKKAGAPAVLPTTTAKGV